MLDIMFSFLAPNTAHAALLPNLLPGASSWSGLVETIARGVIPLGISFVVIMVIYSGFLFVKSQGNEKDLPQAKAALWWAIVGGILLIGAAGIAAGILSVIEGL